jgi:UDP-N-acetylmuramoyl-L-alanyl-D-glutamate--2,6-diaminopimelate ligase
LELLPKDAPAILPEQHELVEMLKKGAHPVLTWGISPDADIRASEVNQSAQGLRFTLMLGGQERSVQSQLFGTFNVDNMLCAAGLAHATGASIDDIANGLANAGAPPGRLERVHVKNMQGKPAVIVDFAHTPDALERTLVALRAAASERLIVVFGCGGNRDKGKRPQMGHIASTFADLIFVTDDNPRHESPEQIRQEVLSGIDAPSLSRCFNVGDRRLAIARAIDMANPKDLVVIAGKGHETTQQIGDEYLPFHDLSIAKSALEEWHR